MWRWTVWLDVIFTKGYIFHVLTVPVLIPDEEKKFNLIFISMQLSEMHGSLRVKKEIDGRSSNIYFCMTY